ncbi:3-oxoacyl-[acyl-carrier-protein] reductase FabG [Vanrija pseudolonga]|uniref:3-oxoacyl-[acyl-carrier-protein] reductase FabG n=1 Tax=Vanrija pseudolonga TaxID=143232 RepID=A0AAF0Y662_9TREE|nr:3-oxoacyl-[acyl-carrier-protein] reductase FabG [Vanrija pseudolonga]
MALRPISTLSSLAGRSAVVTGASSGLGRSIALRLARLGASVVCADLSPGARDASLVPTHELIASNGGKGQFAEVNVTDLGSIEAAIASAVRLSPRARLDIMVNNAGTIGHQADRDNLGIHTEAPGFAQNVFNVNLMGVWNGTHAAVLQMLQQEPEKMPADEDVDVRLGDPEVEGQDGPRGSRGSIVNMGSIHGMVGGPSEAAYSASKAGVINLTRTVAIDYAKDRINANVVCPGYCAINMGSKPTDPEIAARRLTPWPHRGAARDVANAVIYLVRDAQWVTGAVLAVDGGTTAD